jgi:predicted dehydrogenase
MLAVALIGCGGHGRKLAKRLAGDSRVRLSAVCDPDSNRTAALAASLAKGGHPRPAERADLRSLLDDPSIDAVAIATPHHWHALAAVWALQAGKHVYLEKPATHSLAEGSTLIDAWRTSGLVVEVGTQRRSHPGLQEAIAELHDGRIGAVAHARCYSWKRRPPIGPEVRGTWPESLDPDLWFGPRPVQRPTRERFHYDWHWFGDYGNGGLGNNGVHRLDVARWGMQLPAAGDRVMSLAGRLGPQDSGETPNTALTVVAFGARSVLHDLRGRPTRPDPDLDHGMSAADEVVFVGDGASIVVTRTGGRLVDGQGRVVRRYGQDARDVDPITRHLAGFVTACLADDPGAVAVGLPEGVASAGMCHAPATAHVDAEGDGGRVDPDRVRADVRSLCGPVADDAAESFLAHVAREAGPRSVAHSGIRAVAAGAVEGAPESFEYRRGYELVP